MSAGARFYKHELKESHVASDGTNEGGPMRPWEIRTATGATQAGPTFGRADLGAGLHAIIALLLNST